MKTAFLVLAALLFAGAVRGETVRGQSISSVPFVISSPGVYRVTNELNYEGGDGAAIRIDASNVVLDLNGHLLKGKSDGADADTSAIECGAARLVTVRNGKISGFRRAVRLGDDQSSAEATRFVVEDLFIDNCRDAAIELQGSYALARRNFITRCSGIGMRVRGLSARIYENDLSDSGSTAIAVESARACVIERNRISRTPIGNGNTRGIVLLGSTLDAAVIDNRVLNTGTGVLFEAASTGTYRDNVTVNVATPYVGGLDAGNND